MLAVVTFQARRHRLVRGPHSLQIDILIRAFAAAYSRRYVGGELGESSRSKSEGRQVYGSFHVWINVWAAGIPR